MPISRTLVPLALALVLAAPLQAQSGLSLWLGAGRATDGEGFAIKNGHMYGGLQLGLPLLPFALRGEALVAGSKITSNSTSFLGSAVVQLKLPIVQPYAIAGYGMYGRGAADEERGLHFGAGLRVGVSRLGLFAEVRRHDPIRKTLATVGITL